jgi:Asp-tRNA(Asn)/Glu-tRNA(Gln) amidotransferase A subunit family amidase
VSFCFRADAGVIALIRGGQSLPVSEQATDEKVRQEQGRWALYMQRPLEIIGSTAPFDIIHHPAMIVPCGMINGLPVGFMRIGKHCDKPTIYRAAYAFAQAGEGKTM